MRSFQEALWEVQMLANRQEQVREIQRKATILRSVCPGADDVELVPEVTVEESSGDRLDREGTVTITISDDRMTRKELETAVARANLWVLQQVNHTVEVKAEFAEKSATLRLRVVK